MTKQKPRVIKPKEKKTEEKIKKRNFDKRDLIVRDTGNSYDAQEDVEKLEVSAKCKRSIIAGITATESVYGQDLDQTRDWAIICHLLEADYGHDTIRSIFLNDQLLCSVRYRELAQKQLRKKDSKEILLKKRESLLKQDVKFVQDHIRTFKKGIVSPDQQEIQKIRDRKIKKEEKLQRYSVYIVKRLLTDIASCPGEGFYDEDKNIFYFFDRAEKILMDLESTNFYCYLRDRFGLLKRDFDEVRDAVMTTIWKSKKRIEAHTFAYFDAKNFILYISDHSNGIYKLDGEKIEHIENSAEGIFFEFNSEFMPFNINVDKLEGINYFELPKVKRVKTKTGAKLIFPKNEILGFNWGRFIDPKNPTYLKKFLIDRASFALEEEHGLSPEEQRILFTIYFYSLFFESIQKEKPVICFLGLKESGKSFIAESIGKILFGDNYQIRHMSTNPRDFHTLLGTNYYLAFDNLDQYIAPDLLDIFCVAATGGAVEVRKLYTDREKVRLRPKVFLTITSREAKFRRDDFVSRLLLFHTKKIAKVVSRSYLFKILSENRDKIMSEVLINLNTIIKLLKTQKEYNPSGKSRIADFELFIKKVARGYENLFLRAILDKMTTTKDIFAIEGDPLYEILKIMIIEKGEVWSEISSSVLHQNLLAHADILKIEDYRRRYKNPYAIGQRLKNIKDELNKVMKFNSYEGGGRIKYYSFYPLDYVEKEPGANG